jgi:subtilisin family serine protease
VIVAVLDTGVDLTHPALAANLVPGYNVLQPNQAPADTPSSIDSDNDGQVNDALGHGTGVAGIIAAVAPQSRIMPIKVLDSEGMGTAFDVVEGIRYAVKHGAQVINLSLGMDSYSSAVAQALAYATSHNVVVVAAGNTGTQVPLYPSGDPNVLAVAATDASDSLAPFSAYGPFINVTAPGVDIYSSYYNDGYALWNGTSMAAPFVSGEAALLRAAHPDDGAGDIAARVEGSAVPIDALNPTYAGELGAGRIDLLAAVSP